MAQTQTNIPLTLTQSIIHEYKATDYQNDITILLTAIQQACKCVSSEIRTAPLKKLTGLAGTKNSMGEDVKKLDVIANDHFISALINSEKVCGMVSEENGEVITVPEEKINGDFIVCFDPLDGSSNIDVAVPVGSIFAIFRKVDKSSKHATMKDVLQKGSEQVCAGYAMYGSCTSIIIATLNAVHGFTLDPISGEFLISHPNMSLPKKGKVYSVNEGNAKSWDEPMLKYVAQRKEEGASLRYVGSMVADVHRTLLIGGVFMYPADKKSPNGKLRLLYECNPMSFIVEKAGGKSITGKNQSMLDIQPEKIHQRKQIYLGSSDDVNAIADLL